MPSSATVAELEGSKLLVPKPDVGYDSEAFPSTFDPHKLFI
jgi:hypothetical protein